MPRGAAGPRTYALFLAALAAMSLTACGSGTKTVTATTPATAGSAPASSGQATTTTATTTTAPTSSSGGTSATATTRTAPEPEFAQQESHAEGLAAAAALVRAHGYEAANTAEYHPAQTLRVLVGTRAGSSDGHGQQAFFFVDGRYIGTDTKEPSASVKVVAQSDTEVTLSYPLYRHSDPLCCPGGGEATVHFALNDGRLTALDPIPSASRTAPLSRY